MELIGRVALQNLEGRYVGVGRIQTFQTVAIASTGSAAFGGNSFSTQAIQVPAAEKFILKTDSLDVQSGQMFELYADPAEQKIGLKTFITGGHLLGLPMVVDPGLCPIPIPSFSRGKPLSCIPRHRTRINMLCSATTRNITCLFHRRQK